MDRNTKAGMRAGVELGAYAAAIEVKQLSALLREAQLMLREYRHAMEESPHPGHDDRAVKAGELIKRIEFKLAEVTT